MYLHTTCLNIHTPSHTSERESSMRLNTCRWITSVTPEHTSTTTNNSSNHDLFPQFIGIIFDTLQCNVLLVLSHSREMSIKSNFCLCCLLNHSVLFSYTFSAKFPLHSDHRRWKDRSLSCVTFRDASACVIDI